MENPLAIANYFIRKAIDSGEELTSMKLIKLVYISHGWYLALSGKPLLPEAIQAWKYGPVVKSIYQETKKYGSAPISSLFLDSITNTYPLPVSIEISEFLDKIWQLYGKFNGLQLSALTHQAGTPWYTTWHLNGGSRFNSAIIGDELIKEHYKQKLNPVVNGAEAVH